MRREAAVRMRRSRCPLCGGRFTGDGTDHYEQRHRTADANLHEGCGAYDTGEQVRPPVAAV